MHVRHGEVASWGFSGCEKGITSQRSIVNASVQPLPGPPWLAGMSAVSEQAPPGSLLGDCQAVFEFFCLTSTYITFQVHFAGTPFQPKVISFARGLHVAKN